MGLAMKYEEPAKESHMRNNILNKTRDRLHTHRFEELATSFHQLHAAFGDFNFFDEQRCI